jgi:hypothetical protein
MDILNYITQWRGSRHISRAPGDFDSTKVPSADNDEEGPNMEMTKMSANDPFKVVWAIGNFFFSFHITNYYI